MEYPKRVNLGCGNDKLPGYLNIDSDPSHDPDLVADVANLSDLPDRCFQYGLAQDVLEHIPRLRINTALKEWNRVLEEGGELHLRVPNVLALCDLLRQPGRTSAGQHEILLQGLFGTQAYPGDFHTFGFTEVVLRERLGEAGFQIRSLGIKDEWLYEVSCEKVRDERPDPILALTGESLISAIYQRHLGRDPDPEGLRHYLNLLKAGIPGESIIDAVTRSPECVARSGQDAALS